MKNKNLLITVMLTVFLSLATGCSTANTPTPQDDLTTPPVQNTEPAATTPNTTVPEGTDAGNQELDMKVVEGKLNGLIDGNSFEFTPEKGDIMVFRYTDAVTNFEKLNINDGNQLRVQYYNDGVSNIAIIVQKI